MVGNLLLAHILSSRRSAPTSVEGSHAGTHFYSDCPLAKYSSKRLPRVVASSLVAHEFGLKLVALLYNDSVQLVEPSPLHFQKR